MVPNLLKYFGIDKLFGGIVLAKAAHSLTGLCSLRCAFLDGIVLAKAAHSLTGLCSLKLRIP